MAGCARKSMLLMTEKEALHNLIRRIPDFEERALKDPIPLFAWFLQTYCKKEEFTETDIQRFLKYLGISIALYLPLPFSRFPNIVSTGTGYKLKWRARDNFDKQFLSTPTSIEVHQLLKALPAKIPIAEEKTYLIETLKCYSCKANRAAIVMCWNLAFSHLCHFVLTDPSHLTSFNRVLASKFPKEKAIQQSTNSLDLRNFTYWRSATLLSLQTKTSTRY